MVLDWLARKIQSITKKEIKYTHARFEISAEMGSPLVFAGASLAKCCVIAVSNMERINECRTLTTRRNSLLRWEVR